jgi:hypothetical protein
VTAYVSPSPMAAADQHSPIARADYAGDDAQVELRRELFWAVIQGLHESGIPYCVLGAAEDSTASGESDLDFVVKPSEYGAIPQLLADAASRTGGRLVQAIRHETTAIYFAITKLRSCATGFLNPDCISDYRREGRLWMRAEELLCDRSLGAGGFFRPAPDVDFKYYLIKQVLKQTLTDAQWSRLVTLYRSSADPERGLSLWPQPGRLEIESALLRNDPAAFRRLLSQLHWELESTHYKEGPVARAAVFFADGARVASRVQHPTGLFVGITDGRPVERIDLGLRLVKAMAPAFRHTWVDGEFSPAKMTCALIASTLVVSPSQGFLVRAPCGSVTVHCSPSLSPSENLKCAITAVVSHLGERTVRRLKLTFSKPCLTGSELATLGKGAV